MIHVRRSFPADLHVEREKESRVENGGKDRENRFLINPFRANWRSRTNVNFLDETHRLNLILMIFPVFASRRSTGGYTKIMRKFFLRGREISESENYRRTLSIAISRLKENVSPEDVGTHAALRYAFLHGMTRDFGGDEKGSSFLRATRCSKPGKNGCRVPGPKGAPEVHTQSGHRYSNIHGQFCTCRYRHLNMQEFQVFHGYYEKFRLSKPIARCAVR